MSVASVARAITRAIAWALVIAIVVTTVVLYTTGPDFGPVKQQEGPVELPHIKHIVLL